MRFSEVKGPHYTNYAFLLVVAAIAAVARFFFASTSFPLNLQKLSIGLWAGFVGGVSLMEAWMKFHAETVSKYPNELKFVAFDIGRLIFWSLQRMEMVMAAILLALQIPTSSIFLVLLAMLILQVLVVQPKLDSRGIAIVKAAIMEKPIPKIDTIDRIFHVAYVCMEMVKFALLIVLFVQ